MTRPQKPFLLVVDDDPAHRLMLATILEEWGCQVEQAGDGREAVDFARDHSVDLVLMDLRMPNMNGIEAAGEISLFNPGLPIIILTAYSSVTTALKALRAGAFDYLTKPVDFEALRLAIVQALERFHLYQEGDKPPLENPLSV